MAVPKRRTSKARKRKRRANWEKISMPFLTECPQCKENKLSHRVCPECGYYKGRAAVLKS